MQKQTWKKAASKDCKMSFFSQERNWWVQQIAFLVRLVNIFKWHVSCILLLFWPIPIFTSWAPLSLLLIPFISPFFIFSLVQILLENFSIYDLSSGGRKELENMILLKKRSSGFNSARVALIGPSKGTAYKKLWWSFIQWCDYFSWNLVKHVNTKSIVPFASERWW